MAYSTISKPGLHFNTITYTGNGSTQSLTGVGFQPDWVWLKSRSVAKDHMVFDVVRGVQKSIRPNATTAEDNSSEYLTTFGTDGFTLGGNGKTNQNSATYAAWNWKAGNSQGSSNTDGTINTTYTSVNSTAKFSISQYTGTGSNATFGHGLGVAPTFCLHKETSATGPWFVSNVKRTGDTGYMYLDQDITGSTSGQAFYTAKPTSSLINLGTDPDINQNGQTYIAYCFAEVQGFSKFGTYTSNGNADGTFVYLGFKPAWVMVKNVSSTSAWMLYDNKRDNDGNPNTKSLMPNLNNAEDVNAENVDFLSNGFKCRGTGVKLNNSTDTFAYFAFAAEPLVANVGAGVPATAE